MNNKVKFLRGTSNEYAVVEKDSDTIYFTTDDGKLYIGDKEVSGGGSSELPIATTEILGGVMPDGTTITVNENGVITAISAEKLNTSAGSSTRPVYFSGGKPVACSYTLGKSVPSNAVFTDTVYTLPKATTSVLGGVKVDGTTINVDSNGVISSAGGLTVDTLVDVTTSITDSNWEQIYLEKNITDYKFIHCASGAIDTTNDAHSFTFSSFKIIPTSMFNWKTWYVGSTSTGTPFWTYKINGKDVTFFYTSKNKLSYRMGNYLGIPVDYSKILSHRVLILGIK